MSLNFFEDEQNPKEPTFKAMYGRVAFCIYKSKTIKGKPRDDVSFQCFLDKYHIIIFNSIHIGRLNQRLGYLHIDRLLYRKESRIQREKQRNKRKWQSIKMRLS